MGTRKRLRRAQARAIELETTTRREQQAEDARLPWYLRPTLRSMLKARAERDSDIAPEEDTR